MYQNAIDLVRRSMFPLFFRVKQGNSTRMGVSGTAFFISTAGHFLTADHVTTGVPKGATLFYAGNVPYQTLMSPIDVDVVFRDRVHDVCVGRISGGALPPISHFSLSAPM